MAINPENVDTVTVPELDTLALALTNLFAHSAPTGKLGKATINALVNFIAPYVASVGASAYVPISGNVLPTPAITNGFSLIGKGTFTRVGQSNIVTTGDINIISWNGTEWVLTREITIDLSDYVLTSDLDKVRQLGFIEGNKTVVINWQAMQVKILADTNIFDGKTEHYIAAQTIAIPSGIINLFLALNKSTNALQVIGLSSLTEDHLIAVAFNADFSRGYDVVYGNPSAISMIVSPQGNRVDKESLIYRRGNIQLPIKAVSGGTDLQDLNFEVKSIQTKSNFTLPIYEEGFESVYAMSESFQFLNLSAGDINPGVDNASVRLLKSSGTTDKHEAFKTFINNMTCGIKMEIDVIDDNNCMPEIGFFRSPTNNYFFRYDKTAGNCNLQFYNDGAVTQYTSDPTDINFAYLTVPYKLMLMINNRYAFVLGEKNGQYYTLSAINMQTAIGYDFYTNPRFAVLSAGAFFPGSSPAGSSIRYKNLSVGYGSGMSSAADIKVVKNTDGSIYKDLTGCIYITCSGHYGARVETQGPIIIYKLNLKTFERTFTALILSRNQDGQVAGDCSATILRDETEDKWIYSASPFGGVNNNQRLVIGQTDENILYGFHIVNTILITMPTATVGGITVTGNDVGGVWDFDFIRDPSNGKWKGVLKEGHYYEADTPYGTWTLIRPVNGGYEGATICKVNGKYLYTSNNGTTSGIQIYELATGTNLGELKVDKYAKTHNSSIGDGYLYPTPSWGSVISDFENGKSHYYLFLFSLRSFESKQFGYGDFWAYKANELNVGDEFFKTF